MPESSGSEAVSFRLSGYESAKLRVHEVLDITNPSDRAAWTFGVFITTLIVLNVVAVILESVKSLYGSHEPCSTTLSLCPWPSSRSSTS